MYILLLFVGVLGLASILVGWFSSDSIHIMFSFKSFSHMFYRLGLSFNKEVYLDKEVDVFILGLFFCTIQVDFMHSHTEDYTDAFREFRKLQEQDNEEEDVS